MAEKRRFEPGNSNMPSTIKKVKRSNQSGNIMPFPPTDKSLFSPIAERSMEDDGYNTSFHENSFSFGVCIPSPDYTNLLDEHPRPALRWR